MNNMPGFKKPLKLAMPGKGLSAEVPINRNAAKFDRKVKCAHAQHIIPHKAWSRSYDVDQICFKGVMLG